MRLFIAILFEETMLDALCDLQEDMKAQGVYGNYTRRENLHLTLAFIGDYPDPGDVLEAIGEVPFTPFDLALDGVGSFGALFYAGIRADDALAAYVKRLRHTLAEHGIPFDKKRFLPHVTLVRKASTSLREGVSEITIPHASMRVKEVSLMRSDRGKHGMIYTEL